MRFYFARKRRIDLGDLARFASNAVAEDGCTHAIRFEEFCRGRKRLMSGGNHAVFSSTEYFVARLGRFRNVAMHATFERCAHRCGNFACVSR